MSGPLLCKLGLLYFEIVERMLRVVRKIDVEFNMERLVILRIQYSNKTRFLYCCPLGIAAERIWCRCETEHKIGSDKLLVSYIIKTHGKNTGKIAKPTRKHHERR